jgi:hypothetical protein
LYSCEQFHAPRHLTRHGCLERFPVNERFFANALVNPTECVERGRQAYCRQGDEGNLTQRGRIRAGAQRLLGVCVYRSRRTAAHRHRDLGEGHHGVVERAGAPAGFAQHIVRRDDFGIPIAYLLPASRRRPGALISRSHVSLHHLPR